MRDDGRRLKFDRRLMQRRGWTDPQELRSYLDSLPDVSDKIRPPEEAAESGEEGAPQGEPGSRGGETGGTPPGA